MPDVLNNKMDHEVDFYSFRVLIIFRIIRSYYRKTKQMNVAKSKIEPRNHRRFMGDLLVVAAKARPGTIKLVRTYRVKTRFRSKLLELRPVVLG